MKPRFSICGIHLLFVAGGATVVCADEPPSVNWPSFRGPFAGGIVEGYTLPTEWDVETGENLFEDRERPAHFCPASLEDIGCES